MLCLRSIYNFSVTSVKKHTENLQKTLISGIKSICTTPRIVTKKAFDESKEFD